MYKQSNYNIIIGNIGNSELIYNSCSGAVSEFDETTLNFFSQIEKYEESTANEKEKDLITALYENGFIVDEEDNELNWILMQNRGIRFDIHPTRMRLIIAPTMLCNYRCYYCYESKADKQGNMSGETIDALLSYIEGEMHSGLKELYISWYGGEPLVAVDVIQNISEKVIDLCKRKNVIYQADILTNGYLLDFDTACILHDKYNVFSVQIPMDGLAETYAVRKGVEEQTFYKVIDNICDACEMMEIHVRMNVDNDNKNEILNLTRYLLCDRGLLNKIRVYVAPIKNYSNVCNFTDTGCFNSDELFEYKMEFSSFLRELGERTSLLMSTLRKPSYMSCGLSRVKNIIIDSEGDFYRCAHLIGHKENVIGNVRVGQMFNNENMKFLNMEFQDKCKKCNLFPICMGGCYFERMLNCDESSCREKVKRLQHNFLLSYDYLQTLDEGCD